MTAKPISSIKTSILYRTFNKMVNAQTILTDEGVMILSQIHNELAARGLKLPRPYILHLAPAHITDPTPYATATMS